jgi:hypothetical protein
MSVLTRTKRPRRKARCGSMSSTLIAISSFLRNVQLFFWSRPKTPLRVLCVMAFDTVHRLRQSQRLPPERIKLISALLDFAACANAAFDKKTFYRNEFRASRRLLEDAGIGPSVTEFLKRLRALEKHRPSVGETQENFQRVQSYRENIIRLSLGMVAATASGNHCLDQGIRTTYYDEDLTILFRLVMQCQIIDDVLDYSQDSSARLPSFLTASKSLSNALKRTRLAASDYAHGTRSHMRAAFPLRLALSAVSTCAKLVLVLGQWTHCRSTENDTARCAYVLRLKRQRHAASETSVA